jgi:hypothetical protein
MTKAIRTHPIAFHIIKIYLPVFMKDKIIKIFYPTNLMVKKIVPSAK